MALSDNIWWTRKARIQTEKRLLSNAFQAQLLLFWYSFCSVAASIYYLQFNTNSKLAGIVWVIFSVLILSVAGFISGLSFKERALLVKECYETLKGLYLSAEENPENTKNIVADYEQVLGLCENHTDRDYHFALCNEYLGNKNPNDQETGLDRKPTKYIWFLFMLYVVRRFLFLGTLYMLPVVLFLIMEYRWQP